MAKKYIALLRGINVGGKVVKMADLRSVMEAMGFENVQTYIQSGNVVFAAEEQDINELTLKLASRLQDEFGFEIPVLIRTLENLEEGVRNNPFSADEPYVSFLAKEPDQEGIEKLKSYEDKTEDELKIVGREVYIHCVGGYGRTLYSNAFLEKKLGVPATTRNWKTVNKLIDMARSPT
jgi:uncharacterized protein (DUF1697 family)